MRLFIRNTLEFSSVPRTGEVNKRFLAVLEENLADNLRKEILGIVKSKIAYKNLDEFIINQNEENAIPTSPSRDASSSGLLQMRRRLNINHEPEDDDADHHSREAVRQSIQRGRSRNESSPNKSVVHNSSDSDVSKGQRPSILPPERRFSNMTKNIYDVGHETTENLKMISEEDVLKEKKFNMEEDNLGPSVIQRRRKLMELNVTVDHPPRLAKAGTMFIGEQDPTKKHKHHRTPSSGKLASMSKIGKPEEFEATALKEYMISSSPSKNQLVSFRYVEKDLEYQSKVVSLNAALTTLIRKKVRPAWTFLTMASSRRVSTKEPDGREYLKLDLRTIPSMSEDPTKQQSTGRMRMPIHESERSISFNLTDPTKNKDIEYNKVITVARLFIRLQQKGNVMAYHTLQKLLKLNEGANQAQKVSSFQEERKKGAAVYPLVRTNVREVCSRSACKAETERFDRAPRRRHHEEHELQAANHAQPPAALPPAQADRRRGAPRAQLERPAGQHRAVPGVHALQEQSPLQTRARAGLQAVTGLHHLLKPRSLVPGIFAKAWLSPRSEIIVGCQSESQSLQAESSFIPGRKEKILCRFGIHTSSKGF